VSKESETRATRAALAFRCLRAFANWCEEHEQYAGLIPQGAFTQKAVKEAVQPVQHKEGDCLQKEMLPTWFAAVRSIKNPIMSAYIQGLLLTGARRRELSGLKWEDVDFRWCSMVIRDKVEGERTIPMTPHIAGLLAALPRRVFKDGSANPFVFSSVTAADGRLQSPGKTYAKALQLAGVPPVTIHGLRRSFTTLSEWIEMPAGVAAQITGHKPSAIAEKHYRRRPLDLLCMWHVRIEAFILAEAGIQQPEAGTAAPGLRVVA